MKQIILASQSPRRRELLSQAGIAFLSEAADVDETMEAEEPSDYVTALAFRKATKVAERYPGDIIIGADTVVALEGAILGKPRDAQEALMMLRRLSGKTHQVFTGVCVLDGDDCHSFYEKTEVTMYPNGDELLRAYIATGEPMDKAGAYGIQGRGMLLVERICGDYYNVMGLPIARLYQKLRHICPELVPQGDCLQMENV